MQFSADIMSVEGPNTILQGSSEPLQSTVHREPYTMKSWELHYLFSSSRVHAADYAVKQGDVKFLIKVQEL